MPKDLWILGGGVNKTSQTVFKILCGFGKLCKGPIMEKMVRTLLSGENITEEFLE